MDPGSSQLSPSIISEIQDPSKMTNPRDILKYMFKAHKAMIAFAIKKTFPFLETLRDHELITDEFYEELQSDVRKDVPLPNVLYNALKAVEGRFRQQHLDILFHEIHLKEYPELHTIHENFKAVMQKIAYMQDGGRAEGALEGSARPLFLEQETSEKSQGSPTAVSQNTATPNGTTVHVNGVSEHSSDTDEVHAKRKDIPSEERCGLESGQASNHCGQEPEEVGNHCGQEPEEVGNHCGQEPEEVGNHCGQEPEQAINHCGQEPEQASSHCGQEPEQAVSEFCKEALQVDNGDVRKKIPGPLSSAKQRAELSKYALQSNSCFISLVEVMKERSPSNSDTECDQSLDIIEISSDELTDISDGEETPEAPKSALKKRIDDTDLRKSPVYRKHLQKRAKLESFSGSSEDEAPQMVDSMDEGPEDIGNEYHCWTHNQERDFNSDDSTELIIKEEPQETCSSALRRGSGVARCLVSRTDHSQASNMSDATDSRSSSISRRHNWRKKPRIPRDRSMNFDIPELPVTCGKAKGTLYKEKLKQGSSSKCILRESGDAWLSLREFEIEGGMEKCKNWRLSVRCGGWPLKELIKGNHLANPPRTKGRRSRRAPHSTVSDDGNTSYDPCPENSNVCEVCSRSGTLYCCDSCPRSFHISCHIEHINTKRDPWFCIFCSIKTIQENTSPNQSYQKSEVLLRPMDYMNDLKCKFLLLKMYSYSKSSFFVQKPHHSKGFPPGDPRSMCLNRIKDKLQRKKYLKVGAFVRDLSLIIENHKTVYKNKNISVLGYQLEVEFEANFKDIFKIQ